MTIRLATEEEIAELAQRKELVGVEMTAGRVWVAEENSELIGVLPLRLCWQAEPLLLLKEAKKYPKLTRSRAALLMYLAAEEFIKASEPHLPKWLFAITRSPAVIAWSERLGWRRIYKNATMFLKHLPAPETK